MKEVERLSNGGVQFEGHYAQSLFLGTESWEALKGGQADIAFMPMGFFPGTVSLGEVITLPFLPIPTQKSEEAGGILWDVYEKYPNIRAQASGIEILSFISLGPFFPITKNKQIKTLEDFDGIKMRVHGGYPTDMFQALGGVPVPMGINEVYPNMQKGVIDGALLPWEAVISFKPYEVAEYYSYGPFYSSWFIVGMNQAKWNSLPADIQKAFNDAMGGGRARTAWWSKIMSDESFDEGRRIVQEAGTPMTEYTIPDAEIAKMAELGGPPVWDKWVADQEKKGYTEAREMLNFVLEKLETIQ